MLLAILVIGAAALGVLSVGWLAFGEYTGRRSIADPRSAMSTVGTARRGGERGSPRSLVEVRLLLPLSVALLVAMLLTPIVAANDLQDDPSVLLVLALAMSWLVVAACGGARFGHPRELRRRTMLEPSRGWDEWLRQQAEHEQLVREAQGLPPAAAGEALLSRGDRAWSMVVVGLASVAFAADWFGAGDGAPGPLGVVAVAAACVTALLAGRFLPRAARAAELGLRRRDLVVTELLPLLALASWVGVRTLVIASPAELAAPGDVFPDAWSLPTALLLFWSLAQVVDRRLPPYTPFGGRARDWASQPPGQAHGSPVPRLETPSDVRAASHAVRPPTRDSLERRP